MPSQPPSGQTHRVAPFPGTRALLQATSMSSQAAPMAWPAQPEHCHVTLHGYWVLPVFSPGRLCVPAGRLRAEAVAPPGLLRGSEDRKGAPSDTDTPSWCSLRAEAEQAMPSRLLTWGTCTVRPCSISSPPPKSCVTLSRSLNLSVFSLAKWRLHFLSTSQASEDEMKPRVCV